MRVDSYYDPKWRCHKIRIEIADADYMTFSRFQMRLLKLIDYCIKRLLRTKD